MAGDHNAAVKHRSRLPAGLKKEVRKR